MSHRKFVAARIMMVLEGLSFETPTPGGTKRQKEVGNVQPKKRVKPLMSAVFCNWTCRPIPHCRFRGRLEIAKETLTMEYTIVSSLLHVVCISMFKITTID